MHGMIVGRTQSLAEAFNINLDTYTGRTSAYLWPRVHENQYDRETLQHLMEAIEHNNESSFITNLVHFATSFDSETTGPKAAFIDAFTFLYVTKNFPSEALRQLYFHFILRCGQIH
jgi:hypothetical protein